jgi:uncharacterized protein
MKVVFWLFIALAISIPPLTGRIVDNADMLSPDQEASLTRKLADIEQKTSVQIVILTIPSLEGEPIEDYSIRVGDQWKIGQKKIDNGAIIVVSKAERKVRIEIGYGLEPVITDGMAGTIIRDRLAPRFRENDFYGGLNAAVDGLVLAAKKEYPETGTGAQPQSGPPQKDVGSLAVALFFGAMIWFSVAGIFASRGCLAYAVSALTGGALLPGALLFSGWMPPVSFLIAAPVGAVLGLLFTPLLKSMRNSRGSGRWNRSTWTYPYFPGSGRGDRWGGGGFGGGFGGGGGRFGGGGASGSW